jgi:hypothetical protein
LFNYADPGRVTYRNVSAPEACIYRHDVLFVKTISNTLNKEIFDGFCSWYKSNSCSKDGNSSNALSNFGVRVVLETLIEGERAFSNVTSWFSGFSNAMTNRFRFQYGGAAFDASIPLWDDQHLPLGEVQGIAWQTETCVSAHRDWLALPIGLTAITALLMLWTISNNWRNHRTRPVWKESLLPLLFYRNNINSEKPGESPWQFDDMAEQGDRLYLMEASEMQKISKKTLVTFQCLASKELYSSSDNASTSAIALQDAREFPAQRNSHEADAESLLTSHEVNNR